MSEIMERTNGNPDGNKPNGNKEVPGMREKDAVKKASNSNLAKLQKIIVRLFMDNSTTTKSDESESNKTEARVIPEPTEPKVAKTLSEPPKVPTEVAPAPETAPTEISAEAKAEEARRAEKNTNRLIKAT
jgi:hypothetical protein